MTSDVRDAIIKECRENGHTTSIDVAEKYGLRMDSVCLQLRKLLNKGILSRRYILSGKVKSKPAIYQYTLVKEIPVSKLKSEEIEQAVFDMIRENGSVTVLEVHDSTGFSIELVRQKMTSMFKKRYLFVQTN